MAKLHKPLLSLGARGTIADTLTFQKRGKTHYGRQKPIPIDPKSEAQLAQRQRYKDAVAVWNALSPAEKEAWRGVCPGLTAYQCFMRSQLKYPPPPLPIDIGADAIDRPSQFASGWTIISMDNPANATGILTSIEIWAVSDITGLIVGTFYTINTNTLKCRDSEPIPGTILLGSKVTKAVSISVEAGDYIGCYFTDGLIDRSTFGYAGLWGLMAESIDPGDEADFDTWPGDAISLHGIGETQP